ncbi:hypothetical protein B7O87_14875 [Cylindrospermopsis raciborskii CENA303]|uniref:Uncharacterized protein n=1 Tax=Cylindrospermopsis raciborskii CENA303 TaxID=1170769 RepID=A0A1X4G335_9CYAN|nr:hypothetical protein B7O87_14875 [Cylindrospermopsis raciborskii CENA303]
MFNLKAPLFKGVGGIRKPQNINVILYSMFRLKAPLFKQGVFKVGGKLQNDFFKTLFHTAIAPFFRNFGLINIKNQPKN